MRVLRLGVIVPSSNTALEPLTQEIVASLNDCRTLGLTVTVHFARFRVTTIALSASANAQFTLEPMLDAARLLGDAHVDVIGWSGTSASWLGFESDEKLCQAIQEATGIPATTAVQGMNWVIRGEKENVALVTPYTADLNQAIQKNYASIGIDISDGRSRYAGLSDNVSFSAVDDPVLDKMVDEVVQNGAQTVLIMCTNVRAAHRASYWESLYADKDLIVVDSVAATVTAMLQRLGIQFRDNSLARQWGRIFGFDFSD
ncbi:hypothetical protein SEPCBS119000_004068 [Sporothrix epigloea]|uniref:Asp/Glu/hydantoin racemase n=1 Tax=Sporothrix epigloea TaxID=1892477 RepID=A0ABP0DQ15_9PEZI